MEEIGKQRLVVDLVEQARQLRLQAEALEKKVERSLARGTQRVVRPQSVVVKPVQGPYYVGDDGPTEQLMGVVKLMLEERPLRFQEILDATGARDNRVKGVIMRLQREGVRVVDVAPEGTGKALWFIPSDAVLARLTRVKRATERR
jgi:hypothetical protein